MKDSRPILLVEDDIVDAMTVGRVFKDLKITNSLVHMTDGECALDYLRNDGSDQPCVILLDLNMPRMNGIEFLKIIKADEELRKIPVIVLTTSKEEQDKIETFRFGVAGYMVKSIDYKKFVETMRIVDMYWTLSELPEKV
jgi:CheY-like chemotaxis protein